MFRLRAYEGRLRLGVLQEVLDLLCRQVRVHHHDDRSEPQRTEERSHVLFTVRKRDKHAIPRADTGRLHQSGEAAGRVEDVAVRAGPTIREQGSSITVALSDAVAEEVVEDVHWRVRLCDHGVTIGVR